MGATPELVGALPWRGGEPPGEEVDVRLDCWAVDSKRLKPLGGFEDGDEVLFARDRCCPGAWVADCGSWPALCSWLA
jgi:hypothetical protein